MKEKTGTREWAPNSRNRCRWCKNICRYCYGKDRERRMAEALTAGYMRELAGNQEKKDQGIVVGASTVIKWCKELRCKGIIWRH